MTANKKQLLIIGILFIISLWVILAIDIANDRYRFLAININSYGIIPRTEIGFIGIFFSPFLHANHSHFALNLIPLIILGLTTMIFYDRVMLKVLLTVALLGGFLLWLLGQGAYENYDIVRAYSRKIYFVHIGASGLIFGLFGFLFVSGLTTKNIKAFIIAIIVVVLFGVPILAGIMPGQPNLSWEGHLYSLLAGVLAAFFFKKEAAKGLKKTKTKKDNS